MNSRNSAAAIPADYSQCIDQNLKELGDRRFDVTPILSRPSDWCLLDFIDEYSRRGCVSEIVLCSLISLVGSLSHHSFVTNIFTGTKVWLNEAFHIVGSSGEFKYQVCCSAWDNFDASGTNKSFIPEEMIFAHNELNRTYPGLYSSNDTNESDSNETSIKKITGSKRAPWAMLAVNRD